MNHGQTQLPVLLENEIHIINSQWTLIDDLFFNSNGGKPTRDDVPLHEVLITESESEEGREGWSGGEEGREWEEKCEERGKR